MSRRLNDPVFAGMKVIQLPDGKVIITCGCWRLKPERRNANGNVVGSRKHAKGQQALVDSHAAARDWAWGHLRSPDHVTPS